MAAAAEKRRSIWATHMHISWPVICRYLGWLGSLLWYYLTISPAPDICYFPPLQLDMPCRQWNKGFSRKLIHCFYPQVLLNLAEKKSLYYFLRFIFFEKKESLQSQLWSLAGSRSTHIRYAYESRDGQRLGQHFVFSMRLDQQEQQQQTCKDISVETFLKQLGK